MQTIHYVIFGIMIIGVIAIIVTGIVWKIKEAQKRKKEKKEQRELEELVRRAYKNLEKAQENNYQREKSNSNTKKIYKAKKYQTEAEKEFYNKLLRATYEMDVQIIPQVPLSSVVEKTIGQYQNELYRIIDYGVFDKDFNLIVLIELNDKTHLQKDRYIRDLKVNNICEEANIKIIKFWTTETNEIGYIRNRIGKIIEERKTA